MSWPIKRSDDRRSNCRAARWSAGAPHPPDQRAGEAEGEIGVDDVLPHYQVGHRGEIRRANHSSPLGPPQDHGLDRGEDGDRRSSTTAGLGGSTDITWPPAWRRRNAVHVAIELLVESGTVETDRSLHKSPVAGGKGWRARFARGIEMSGVFHDRAARAGLGSAGPTIPFGTMRSFWASQSWTGTVTRDSEVGANR